MKLTLTIIAIALLAGMVAAPGAWAQVPGWGNSQQMMFEDGNFNNFAQAHPQIAQDLMHNPSLANNPSYLASHPQLVNFMKKYPNAGASLRSNPSAFLHQDVRRTYGTNPGPVVGHGPYVHHHHPAPYGYNSYNH